MLLLRELPPFTGKRSLLNIFIYKPGKHSVHDSELIVEHLESRMLHIAAHAVERVFTMRNTLKNRDL